jgi:hypothetical protein
VIRCPVRGKSNTNGHVEYELDYGEERFLFKGSIIQGREMMVGSVVSMAPNGALQARLDTPYGSTETRSGPEAVCVGYMGSHLHPVVEIVLLSASCT